MAFASSAMQRISNSGANSVYQYTTNDTVLTVVASGYFSSFTADLKQGDQIICSADLDGTPDLALVMISSATGASTVTTVGL